VHHAHRAARRATRERLLILLTWNYAAGAAALGLGATAFMDLWNLTLKSAFGVRSLDYCLLGRWVALMPAGTFRHASIAAAARQPGECAVGWIAHYSIGVAFGLVFVVLTGDWLARPTLAPALLFGIVTVVFPYFLLQPALGLGIASAKTPDPMRARLKSLTTHAVFGVGLYLAAKGAGALLDFAG
jgi:hypothetical protein